MARGVSAPQIEAITQNNDETAETGSPVCGTHKVVIRHRVRIRFRKEGDLRLISHRDLLRTMERWFRRADLQLSMSEGFHPKPRMSFPLALALGVRGTDEVMELELAEEIDGETVRQRLLPHAPPGISIQRVEVCPPGAKKAAVTFVELEMPVPPERRAALADRIDEVMASSEVPIPRRDGQSLDVREQLDSLELREERLHLRLKVSRSGLVRPGELLELLHLADLESQGYFLTRSRVELAS